MLDLKSTTTLYYNPDCLQAFTAIMACHEKELIIKYATDYPISVAQHCTPVLTHNSFVVFNLPILLEYLEERFPTPAYMPMEPIYKATHRMLMERILSEWYPIAALDDTEALARILLDSDIAVASTPFFMSKTFTILDILCAPLLHKISISPCRNQIGRMQEYSARILRRPTIAPTLCLLDNPPCNSSSSLFSFSSSSSS